MMEMTTEQKVRFGDLRAILRYVPLFRGQRFVVAVDGAVLAHEFRWHGHHGRSFPGYQHRRDFSALKSTSRAGHRVEHSHRIGEPAGRAPGG